MSEFPDTRNNAADILSGASKALANLIPIVGPFIAEIAAFKIPNQRIDRVCNYLEILKVKLSEIEELQPEQALQSDGGLLLLFEKTIQYSSTTNSTDKYSYFSEFIVNSIRDRSIDEVQKERILDLLAELNEYEVVLIIFYSLQLNLNSRNKFVEEHQAIIYPKQRMLNEPIENGYNSYFKTQYLTNLEKLGLISRELEVNRESGAPEIDSMTGEIKIRKFEITPIGRVLVNFIGGGRYQDEPE